MNTEEPLFSSLMPLTVEIGSLFYPSRPAVFVWRMGRLAQQSLWAWALIFACPCMSLWRSGYRLLNISLICKHPSRRITRHQAMNDVIARAFVSADIPVMKEPNGLSIADNKRPDGLTLLPWHAMWLLSARWRSRMSRDAPLRAPWQNWRPHGNQTNM